MNFRRILAAVLIMVLTIGPAVAANCLSACNDRSTPALSEMAAMDDMAGCHHDHPPSPEKNRSQLHDHCTKAGCHSISAAAFLPVAFQQFTDGPSTAHPNFVSIAISADIPPPLKPPA